VLRGIEGFGTTSQIHTARLLSLSQDLPIAVIIVDAPERIQTFLLELDLIVTEGAAARRDRHAGRWHRRRVHHLGELGLGVSRWARTAPWWS
jgi:PII-like signaling protein